MMKWVGVLAFFSILPQHQGANSVMVKRLVFALLVSAAMVWAGKKDETMTVVVFGNGNATCGKVAMNLERAENGESHLPKEARQWVLGNLTGIMMGDSSLFAKLSYLDADAIDGWIVSYCRENPLEILATATRMLIADRQKAFK